MRIPIDKFFRFRVDVMSFGFVYIYNFPILVNTLDKGIAIAPYRMHYPMCISKN